MLHYSSNRLRLKFGHTCPSRPKSLKVRNQHITLADDNLFGRDWNKQHLWRKLKHYLEMLADQLTSIGRAYWRLLHNKLSTPLHAIDHITD